MAGTLDPAKDILSGGFSSYFWVIVVLAVLAIVGVTVWWATKFKKKNSQWTHKLNVKIELPNGDIDERVVVHKMRRWKHKDEQTAPLFELEKPLIGSRIMTELEKYSGATSYEIVLGNDGRLYLPTKTIMCRDKNAMEVSVKHAGIDRARQQYNNRFEQMNATPSKVDMLTLMKYGLIGAALIVVLVLGITGIKSWGERASYDAAAAQAEVASWDAMGETMESVESALNTITLILPDLKQLYGNNIQGAIRGNKEALNKSNG
jgi:hypothetical protein